MPHYSLHSESTVPKPPPSKSLSSCKNSAIHESSVDQLRVLFQQEEESSAYHTKDYLTTRKYQLTVNNDEYEQQYPTTATTTDTDTTSDGDNDMETDVVGPEEVVDKEVKSSLSAQSCHHNERECGDNEMLIQWRKHSCLWAFQVAKFFGLNREVVTIGMNHLDRYLAFLLLSEESTSTSTTPTTGTTTPIKTISKQDFQLWVLTSLYLAIKLNHGCCGIDDRLELPSSKSSSSNNNNDTTTTLETMCQLSDPHPISPEALQETELEILQALQWQVHPPTPQSFLRLLWNPTIAQQLLHRMIMSPIVLPKQKHPSSRIAAKESIGCCCPQWFHDKVYNRVCLVLDQALQEYEISLFFSVSELAIATLLNVVEFCQHHHFRGHGSSRNAYSTTPTPSMLLLSQWKSCLGDEFEFEFETKFQSTSIDACRQHLEQYFQKELLAASKRSGMKKRRNDARDDDDGDTIMDPSDPDWKESSMEDQDKGSWESPPTTKKARLRAMMTPSPACIRDPMMLL